MFKGKVVIRDIQNKARPLDCGLWQVQEGLLVTRVRKRVHTYEVAPELDVRSLPAAVGLPGRGFLQGLQETV